MSVLFTALINVSLLAETLCAILSLHSLLSPLEMSVMELAQTMSWLWLVGSRGRYKWWDRERVKVFKYFSLRFYESKLLSWERRLWATILLFHGAVWGQGSAEGFQRPGHMLIAADNADQAWWGILDTIVTYRIPYTNSISMTRYLYRAKVLV